MNPGKRLILFAITFVIVNALQAQQEEKTPKPLPEAVTKPPSAGMPSAAPVVIAIAADAVPAKPVPAADAVKPEEMKGTEINTGTQKGLPIQNADRPKQSTINVEKKAEPVTKPKPVTAPAIEG